MKQNNRSSIRAINWELWQNWYVKDVMSNISDQLGFKPMGDMSWADALWSQEGCGIYIFYTSDFKPLYIGKVASRSFLERISGHLDTHVHKGGSENGWFNTFQQRWVERYKTEDVRAKHDYLSTVGFNTLKMPYGDSDLISKIEKILIHVYDPILNRRTQISKKSKYRELLENIGDPINLITKNVAPAHI